MTSLPRRQVAKSIVAISAGAGLSRHLPARAQEKFIVFDALLHRGKPASTVLGMRWLPTAGEIWRQGRDRNQVDVEGLRAALHRVPPGQPEMFLDIETWPLLQVQRGVRDGTIAKLQQVVDVVRTTRPALRFGFYSFPPLSVYWPLVIDAPREHAEWLDANAALEPIARQVDMVFPSLYTFYDDLDGWKKAAGTLLATARQYGKPVYPFLWFEFHDSNDKLRDTELPLAMWREQLEFCRARADGVVLWGGWQRFWNKRSGWWTVARDVLGLQSG